MSLLTKKRILVVLSLFIALFTGLNLISELLEGFELVSFCLNVLIILVSLFPLVLILSKKNIKHLYYTTFPLAISCFLATSAIGYLFSLFGCLISLYPSKEEKPKLERLLKRHPIYFVLTIITLGMGFLNFSSVFIYLKDLIYGFDMLGELLASLLLFLVFIILKKTNVIFNSKFSLRETIFVIVPFALYTLYIGSTFLLINVFQEAPLIDIDDALCLILLYLFVGVFEEFLIRGLSLNIFLEKFGNNKKGIWLSIVISSVLFGLIHFANLTTGASFQGVLIQVISASFLGIYLSALYLRSGSVWTTAILHGIYDLAVSIPNLFKTSEFVDSTTQYGEAISNYNWFSVVFTFVFVLGAMFLLRDKKMKNVIALRNGEEIKSNNQDVVQQILIGLGVGGTLFYSVSLIPTMYNLNVSVKSTINNFLTKIDYQKEYTLPFINGTINKNELSDEVKLLFAINNLDQDDFEYSKTIAEAEKNVKNLTIETYISKKSIDESLADVFGKDTKVKYVDVNVSYKTTCNYLEKDEKYVCATTNNEEDNGLKVYSNIANINLEGISNVEVSMYYLIEDTKSNTLYADADLKTVFMYNTSVSDLVGNVEYDENDNKNTDFWNAIRENSNNRVPLYKLKFSANDTLDHLYYDKTEFDSNSLGNINEIKEKSIDDEFYELSTNEYKFEYSKKDFDLFEEVDCLTLKNQDIPYLEIRKVDSKEWLNKYKIYNTNEVIFGNNTYFHYGNEYLIYDNNFYILTIPRNNNSELNNKVINILGTLEFINND